MRQKIITKFFIASFVFVQFLFYSCRIHHSKDIICVQNLKEASDLAYNNPTRHSALDSSLTIINRCMRCDSIKPVVVDLKIRLLIALGRFKEGSKFIDSLQVSDFRYPYKKKLNHDNFIALGFSSIKDTISHDKVFKKMATDIEKYINSNNLNSKEFQEAFLDLYSIKGNFTDSVAINREVDSLEIKYPDNVKFFEFLRK